MLGQRATSTAPDGTTISYAYDGLGRQAGVDYPAPEADVSFSYDARGQRVRMTDGLGMTTWTYDDLGRATEILDPFGKTVSYGYDGHSNRTRLSYPDGKVVNYAYDGLDRLESVTDWNNGVTGYTYTAIGQLVQVGLPNGVTSAYAYDPAGRLASIEHQRGEALLSSFAYSYDPAGNRSGVAERVRGLAEVELPAGWTPPAQFSAGEQGLQSIALGWPEEAGASGYRLERSTDGANWVTLAELDAAAQYYLDDGLARHTQYWYRLTAQVDGGGTPATLATATGYAAVAAPVAGWAEGELATTEIAYQYDELSRLTEANYSDGTYFYYGYDANGNRLSETTQAGEVASVYDVANRLTSVGGVAYTWDANGNLTGDGTRNYAYDSANRLKSVVQDDQTTNFAYNGLGDRLVEDETQFVMDLSSGLTQALQAGEYSYLYGSGRIGQFSGAESASFLGDALGSVRQLANAGGEVTLVQSYAPYGEVLEIAGDGKTEYAFTGEWSSASTNLLYLRARFYDGSTGRFLTRDTWEGDNTISMSYNQWLYVYANPVNFIDPGGMCIDLDANGECDEVSYPGGYSGYILANFDEKDGKFTKNDKDAIESALWDVGMAYSKAFSAELTRRVLPCLGPEQMGGIYIQRIDPVSALKLLHGDKVTFKKIDSDPGNWGITSSARLIYIYKKGTLASVSHDIGRYKRFAVHEMGHAFENALSETLGAKLGRNTLANGQYKDLITPKVNDNPKNGNGIYNGFAGGSADWQWRLTPQQLYEYEVFADMYLGWVYDTWEKDPGGNLIPIAQRRSDFMKDNMEAWVYRTIQVRLGRKVD